MSTMKIMPSDKSQGDYVVINASDFDDEIHKEFKEPKKRGPKPKKEAEEVTEDTSDDGAE